MALSICSRSDGGIGILEVTGNLTLGPRLRAFQSRADSMLTEKKCTGLVLNFAGLSALDSAGIGELVKIHSRAVNRGVSVILVRASSRVKEILAITRVDSLFSFADDERSALRDLR